MLSSTVNFPLNKSLGLIEAAASSPVGKLVAKGDPVFLYQYLKDKCEESKSLSCLSDL